MNASAPVPKNIVLIGFMGCGKSTIGRELHHLLGYEFVDTDTLIESRAQKPITRIFAEDGETAFRELETAVLADLARPDEARKIIATGGGIVVRPENRELLQNIGYVVWLHAPVDVILERTSRNRDRPLLHTDDPRGKIDALLTERKPLYEAASHLKVETAGLSANEIACGILESARYFFTHLP